jgi:hypothetical protein
VKRRLLGAFRLALVPLLFVLTFHCVGAELGPNGYQLIPIQGEDGSFETVTLEGRTLHRGVRGESQYPGYMYFRLPDGVPKPAGTAYVEIEYLDNGYGRLAIQYNAPGKQNVYRLAEVGYNRFLSDRKIVRTAVFKLATPEFRRAQNFQTDLRLCGPGGSVALYVLKATLFLEPSRLFQELDDKPWLKPYHGPTRTDVSAKTLKGKVLCGYQGWFRCPGDPAERGWVHWCTDASQIRADNVSIEMWPDLNDFPSELKYPAAGFTQANGTPAYLFSSADSGTVDQHFEWMRKYGIDGVLVQQFVSGVEDPENKRVLGYARDAANRTGRVFAVEYDMTGVPGPRLYDSLTRDWKHLVDEVRITEDARYLHHNGKPVLAVWGFFSDRFDAYYAERIIDFFKRDKRYSVTLVGGVNWPWREDKNADWARVYRSFDVISPWNVGNFNTIRRGETGWARARMDDLWPLDLAESRRAGMLYMPVIYPGFGWDNLQHKKPGTSTVHRRGGQFFWEQFVVAARLKMETVKVAMFDEVDEGTAIFKVTNMPPRQAHFLTYDGLPSDWYLRLTGEGARMLRKQRPVSNKIPLKP